MQLDAGFVVAGFLAVASHAHVAGGDPAHRARVVVKNLGGGKARIDFDAHALGLARQPAA